MLRFLWKERGLYNLDENEKACLIRKPEGIEMIFFPFWEVKISF